MCYDVNFHVKLLNRKQEVTSRQIPRREQY
jgi:hypothetical protein